MNNNNKTIIIKKYVVNIYVKSKIYEILAVKPKVRTVRTC